MKVDNQLKIIDPLNDTRWDEFVNNHPEGSVFHLSNWAKVMINTYNFKPFYLISENASGNIKSVLPFFLVDNGIFGKKLISIPFTDFVKPLIDSDDNYQVYFEKYFEIYRKEKLSYIEIRGDFLNSDNVGFEKNDYFRNFVLNITPDLETVWKRCKPTSVRYSIKKSKKMGVEIEKSKEKDAIRIFYNLNVLTRKKHGIIPQPYAFFENIWRFLIAEGYGFVSIAWYDKIPIAASIFLEYKDNIYHKFNASDNNFNHYRSNYLILWDAIKYSYDKGIKYLDLGRTSPDNKGLMQFKRQWGTDEFELPYYYYPEVKGISSMKQSSLKYKIVTYILKKSHPRILEFLGDRFYRYFT